MFAQAIRNRLQQLSETVMVILYDVMFEGLWSAWESITRVTR